MTEENGLSCPLRFYNMLVHLRTGSRPAEENVAVKNIWQKDNLVFMDLYFYRSKKSQVIDSVYVKDIFDLSTELCVCFLSGLRDGKRTPRNAAV